MSHQVTNEATPYIQQRAHADLIALAQFNPILATQIQAAMSKGPVPASLSGAASNLGLNIAAAYGSGSG